MSLKNTLIVVWSWILATLIIIGILIIGLSYGAAAETQNITVELSDDNETITGEVIDERTTLLEYEYSDGTWQIEIESDRPQEITLTDAFSALDGGHVHTQDYSLHPGRNTITFDATDDGGDSIITIGTSSALYAITHESDTIWIGAPYASQDLQIAAFSGATSIAIVSIAMVIYNVRRDDQEAEVIA